MYESRVYGGIEQIEVCSEQGKMENTEETAGTVCNYERSFFILAFFFSFAI